MDTLTVVISSPTHSPHKFSIDLGRQATIKALKDIIVTRLDTKTTITDHRLIFGGRILDDEDTLGHIFEKTDCSNPPTIHLVVSHRLTPTQSSAPASPAPFRFRFQSDSTTSDPTPSTPTPTLDQGISSGTNLPSQGHDFYPTPASSMAYPPVYGQLTGPMPYQYVMVNGMPYLIPASYLPVLRTQQLAYGHPTFPYGPVFLNPDGSFHLPTSPTTPSPNLAPAPGLGAAAPIPERNAQENAARDQRRAASLWLLMKLAFGVYLFSQNGGLERIALLHIVALIIFLHQTGRLRIVRRIHPLADAAQQPQPNVGQTPLAEANAQQRTTTSTTTSTASSSSSTAANSVGTSVNQDTTQRSREDDADQLLADRPSISGQGDMSNSHSSPAPSPVAQQQQARSPNPAHPRVSPWRNVEHALLTFVTSLVPAPPPDIDPAAANAAAAGERGM